MNPLRPLFLGALALALAACTTITYEGPERTDGEVATIKSIGTMIATIDGTPVPYSGGNYATFKVLPGRRTLGVHLNDNTRYPLTRTSKNPLPARFTAEAGKTYVVKPAYSGSVWSPEVLEEVVSPGK